MFNISEERQCVLQLWTIYGVKNWHFNAQNFTRPQPPTGRIYYLRYEEIYLCPAHRPFPHDAQNYGERIPRYDGGSLSLLITKQLRKAYN